MARGGTGRAGRIHYPPTEPGTPLTGTPIPEAERPARVEGVNCLLAANPTWRLMDAIREYEREVGR